MPEETVAPETPDELAEFLEECGSVQRTIESGGAFTKRNLGGEIASPACRLSTSRLNRLLAYEPNDLTLSVEAGMPYRELSRILAEHNQMLPIDPPFEDRATIGGVLAADTNGPRRRRYGGARDMTIGMKFATLEGKLIASGGMVVKNVTGLDMAKLLIGSFGTLGVMATVNFRVFPRPETSRTFAFLSDSIATALALRRAILTCPAQPAALDLLNAEGARRLGLDLPGNFALLAEGAGSEAVVKRYRREYETLAREAGAEFLALGTSAGESVWRSVRNFTGTLTAADPNGFGLRISYLGAKLSELVGAIETAGGEAPLLARAGTGVAYLVCSGEEKTEAMVSALRQAGWRTLVEHGPLGRKGAIEQWAAPGAELGVMQRIKRNLDPHALLNPGRLFNRI